MITKLRVENYKCLRDVSVELRPFTVLIGKNDTGKSSLLEALWVLGKVARGVRPKTNSEIEKLVSMGAQPAEVRWSVELSSAAASLGEPLRAAYSSRDASASDGVKLLSHELTTSDLYRLEPERLAEPGAFDLHADHEPRLAADGRGLPLVLDHVLGTDRAAFDAIERELQKAVPYVKSIRLKSARVSLPNGGTTPGKALFFELHPGGFEIPATSASQGVLLFLAYLTLAHVPTAPSILLIEEPENGIHPRQLQRVAEHLKRLTAGEHAAQIVTATHSPYFLDFVPPEDVLVFGRKDSGETVARPLLSLAGVRERLDSGFSLGEMWFNVGEDRLLAEALS